MGTIFKESHRFLPDRSPGIFVEIGSDRWEGSTEYFAQIAKQHGSVLHTVDIVDSARQRLQSRTDLSDVVWHVGKGSEWTRQVYPQIALPIVCLYLDNFDYDWQVTLAQPMIQEQTKWYKETLGIDMTNQNCQVEHLAQMINLMPWMAPSSVVICDDTYLSNHCWIGKGGGVVLYLLTQGYNVVEIQDQAQTSYGVILSRG